jgi:hypothetical protein
MTRRARIVIGIFILAASLTLLVWSLAPMRREIRTQPIAPSDLQLPTPSSLLTQLIPVS